MSWDPTLGEPPRDYRAPRNWPPLHILLLGAFWGLVAYAALHVGGWL
jgi:hypothetical protein